MSIGSAPSVFVCCRRAHITRSLFLQVRAKISDSRDRARGHAPSSPDDAAAPTDGCSAPTSHDHATGDDRRSRPLEVAARTRACIHTTAAGRMRMQALIGKRKGLVHKQARTTVRKSMPGATPLQPRKSGPSRPVKICFSWSYSSDQGGSIKDASKEDRRSARFGGSRESEYPESAERYPKKCMP